jgi:tRNA-specific 2-thiouridylase
MSGKKRILVAMSGGVDSSTAAWLLQEEGLDVAGVFMSRLPVHGQDSETPQAARVRRVAEFLEMPFEVVDFSDAFELLMDFFCSEYLRGRTPNPCALCNREIKFGRLLDLCDQKGFDALATGHYVRSDLTDSRWCLRRGSDPAKDQSYYLFGLSQEQVARAVFPLGDRTKEDVRALARKIGLPSAEAEESQDICFVPEGEYSGLVRRRKGADVHPGDIVDASGKVVGRHEGIVDFTVGQRRGVGVAMGQPVYVVDIDPRTHRVVIGPDSDLRVSDFAVESVNWVGIAPPREPFRCDVQVRYRAKPFPAKVTLAGRFGVHVTPDEPQRAVSPGQAAVFYRDDLLLGGGWIMRKT